MIRARALILLSAILLIAVAAVLYARFTGNTGITRTSATLKPKLLTVTAFQIGDPLTNGIGEATAWVKNDQLTQTTTLPGLDTPLYCNVTGSHCLLMTGVGTSNAAVSMTVVASSDQLDLSQTYIMFAGLASIPPDQGTLGAAAWASHVVDGNQVGEIDAREMPDDWQYPKAQWDCSTPTCSTSLRTGAELYVLNPTLTGWAYQLSKDTALADDAPAQKYRALYSEGSPARRAPFILSPCAFVGDRVLYHGKLMSDWAKGWVNYWTQGKAPYCMAAGEETAMLTALTHLSKAGRADLNRVLVLRGASNFDQPHAGQTAQESLQVSLGVGNSGSALALENVYRAGSAVNKYILDHWSEWEKGVPPLP